MRSISIRLLTAVIPVLLFFRCQNKENAAPSCQCGSTNQARFTGNSITTEKTIFDASGYSYQFCSTQAGDLTSGFAKTGSTITNCSSLIKTVGFSFTVKSDPLGSFLNNSLGADLFVIIVDNQSRVLELKHPSNSTWTSSPISNTIQATGSIASYWSTSLQYHYVYFIGTDGGLHSIYKDTSTGTWTQPGNLLPLVGLSNNAIEISSASISKGTAGDDLFISFKTTTGSIVNLAHLSTETWKVL